MLPSGERRREASVLLSQLFPSLLLWVFLVQSFLLQYLFCHFTFFLFVILLSSRPQFCPFFFVSVIALTKNSLVRGQTKKKIDLMQTPPPSTTTYTQTTKADTQTQTQFDFVFLSNASTYTQASPDGWWRGGARVHGVLHLPH